MINELIKSEFFKNVEIEKIERILSQVRYFEKSYSKGEVIANEEEKCSSIGLILAGTVQIERLYSNGKSITLQRLKSGDVFGEALVFSSTGNYPATVESIDNTKIMFINRDEILKLCLKEPDILENFMNLLSDKVFMLNAKIKSISFKSLKQRVINYIIERSRVQNSLIIKLNESKEAIAASLGIPRPSLSRELIRLREDKLISFSRDQIIILNLKDLEEELFY